MTAGSNRRQLMVAAASLAAAGPWVHTRAAAPARIVVGFPAGSPNDVLARLDDTAVLVAAKLDEGMVLHAVRRGAGLDALHPHELADAVVLVDHVVARLQPGQPESGHGQFCFTGGDVLVVQSSDRVPRLAWCRTLVRRSCLVGTIAGRPDSRRLCQASAP